MEINSEKIAIALAILIALVAIGQGLWLYPNQPRESPETPTIAMSVEQTGNLNYSFKVALVTTNSLLWRNVLVDVDPRPISIIAPSDADCVSSGDELIIMFSSEMETEVNLLFEPNGLTMYSLDFTPLELI